MVIVFTILFENAALVFLASQNSKRGRSTQRQSLEVIANMATGSPDILACNWAGLRFQHTAAIRARLAERYSAATANRMLSALRGTLQAAWRLGQMTGEDYYKARDVDSVRGETLPAGRALSAGEIAALMAACENDPTAAGARDAALIATMYPGGLRRGEVADLALADYDPETGALTVRHGKRNKARINYLSNGAARAMADWLKVRGSEKGPLFYPVNKGGAIMPRRITNQAVYNALQKRGAEAGVKDFSPHDLRRTFTSDLLDAGADISTVARMAGHASVTTTTRYDRRPEQAKQKAAGLLHLPYRGRMV
jgi:integrase